MAGRAAGPDKALLGVDAPSPLPGASNRHLCQRSEVSSMIANFSLDYYRNINENRGIFHIYVIGQQSIHLTLRHYWWGIYFPSRLLRKL